MDRRDLHWLWLNSHAYAGLPVGCVGAVDSGGSYMIVDGDKFYFTEVENFYFDRDFFNKNESQILCVVAEYLGIRLTDEFHARMVLKHNDEYAKRYIMQFGV